MYILKWKLKFSEPSEPFLKSLFFLVANLSRQLSTVTPIFSYVPIV